MRPRHIEQGPMKKAVSGKSKEMIEALLDVIGDRDAPVREVCVGPFVTAVWGERVGMAYTFVPEEPHADFVPVPKAGGLRGTSAKELANWALSEVPLRASIGMAALNSLLPADESQFEEANAAQILMDVSKGRKVALVGHFPFVPKLREVAGELWVFEKRPLPGDLPAEIAEELLPQAEVVAITGSAFVNHTIGHLLELSKKADLVMVLGPTTPLSETLFHFGVNILAGSVVMEPERALLYIREGATFRQVRGVKKVVMRK